MKTSHRLRNGLIIGGCALVVLFAGLAIVGAAINSHGKQAATPSHVASNEPQTSPGASKTSPVSLMFDPNASKAQTVASIKQDFCGPGAEAVPVPTFGYTFVNCAPDSIFYVYSGPQAMHIALDSGAIKCDSGTVVVIGTNWAAEVFNADDAARLVNQGASTGTCN